MTSVLLREDISVLAALLCLVAPLLPSVDLMLQQL